MANKVVKESGLPIFVKDVQVLATGGDVTTLAKPNDLVIVGAVAGLVGQTPRKGEDGAYYATVDTAALVRISGVAVVLTDKQPVYLKASDKSIGTATGAGISCIGYADRPKPSATAGDAWVQLIPAATGA